MIGVWGHGENRNYATFKITLYLSIGALLALGGLIALLGTTDKAAELRAAAGLRGEPAPTQAAAVA